VGKTLTVECLSDSLKIPLLPFSCGALGTDPAYIELNLRRLFRKAERWNCLILFDEADVVLVERDRNQMAQNEICSSKQLLVLL
jgi:ATPase family associated with various cellular activities (AAA)